MNNLQYRGYGARFEYDQEDRIFVGRLSGIDTISVFHGTKVDELESVFHASVDHYLEICERLGQSPQMPDEDGVAVAVPIDIEQRCAPQLSVGERVCTGGQRRCWPGRQAMSEDDAF